MILDRSDWRPAGTTVPIAERRITRTAAPKLTPLAAASPADRQLAVVPRPRCRGFGRRRSGCRTNGTVPSGKNILWQVPIPGLGHSSPVIWGDRIFVTSAVSSRGKDSFKPGLYGDGDASDDRSPHKWTRVGIRQADRQAALGSRRVRRPAGRGAAHQVHLRQRDAGHRRTDRHRVVRVAGRPRLRRERQLPVESRSRAHPSRRLRHSQLRVGTGQLADPLERSRHSCRSTRMPTRSSSRSTPTPARPCGRRRATSFRRGARRRWSPPPAGPELVTNASKLIRGYDPRTGKELWRLGGSSKITAPTPIFADGLIVVASGRAPERPIFAIKAGARGDLTLAKDATTSASIAWSRTGRGSYMPTPLIHDGILYVLGQQRRLRCVRSEDRRGDLSSAAVAGRQRLQRVTGRRGRQDLPVERRRRDAGRRRRSRVQADRHQLRWATC